MLFLFAKIFFFLLPFQFTLPIAGEDIPLLRGGAAGLLLLFLAKILVDQKKIVPQVFLYGFLLSWLLLMTLSVLFAQDVSLGIRKLILLWNLFPLVFIWGVFLNEQEKIYSLVRALIIGSVLSALIGLGIFFSQFFLGIEKIFSLLTKNILPFFLGERLGDLVVMYPSLLVNIGGETWLRVTAFFPDPHVASFFFGITACLALGLFFETKQNFFLYSSSILFLADILTFSRGGYLGMFIVLASMFFIQKNKWGLKPFLWFAGLLPLLLWAGGPIYERFFSSFILADASSTDRLLLWRTAWETILQAPLFGLGLGNYAEWIHPGLGATIPYYAHNLYLDIAVEGGLISLFLFLGLSGLAFFRAWRLATQGNGLNIGVFAALSLYFVHSFFETALYSIHVTILLSLLLILPFADTSRKHPVE